MHWIAPVNVETPGGLPQIPGLDKAADRIISDGGILGSLLFVAVIAIIVLIWLSQRRASRDIAALEAAQKEHDREREDWQKQLHDLNNQRFVDMREIMTALNSSTAALNVISQAQVDRNASSQEIAKTLSEVGLVVKANSGALDRNLEEIRLIARRSDDIRLLPASRGS